MLMAHGFLRRIFEVFDRYETPVDMVATTRSQRLADHRQSAAARRTSRASCASSPKCPVEEDQAIVCLVGDNIRYTPGVASRVFSALDDINIRMISQGARC